MTKLWDVEKILRLLADCGAVGLHHYCRAEVEIKSDHSPVTVADREIENMIFDRLADEASGVYMIGEETLAGRSPEYLEAAIAGDCYVVDPIDGTAPYISGASLWGVSIGLARGGKMCEGAIYLPVQDEAIISCNGGNFIATGLQKGEFELLPLESHIPDNIDMRPICVAQKVAKNRRITFANPLFMWGSCVGVYHALLHGRIYAMVQNCKWWDFAGGAALLANAGFYMSFADGRAMNLDDARGDFNLAADAGAGRWRQRDFCVISCRADAAPFIWQNLKDF